MRITKIIKVILCVIIGALLFGVVVEHLWNWLMPTLFSLRTIDFKQAIGLVVLSKLLFGGFHRHGGGGGRRWKKKMQQRWATMTPEERERFRAGMRGRHCGWPPREEPTTQASSQIFKAPNASRYPKASALGLIGQPELGL